MGASTVAGTASEPGWMKRAARDCPMAVAAALGWFYVAAAVVGNAMAGSCVSREEISLSLPPALQARAARRTVLRQVRVHLEQTAADRRPPPTSGARPPTC